MIARSLDVAVSLKLLLSGAGKTYAQLSKELGLSASEIHAAVRRGVEGNLIDPESRQPYRRPLEEYLLHGVRYAFPVRMGAISRGVPTAYAAPPLAGLIQGDELPPVWPHPEGRVRGQAVEPLYPSAPKAAALDGEFYEMLALVDDRDLHEVRPTKDVDVIVEIVTLGEYYALEERLRSAGFQHDISEGAPICRWIIDGCLVDIMPTEAAPLGLNSKWFPEALASAEARNLGEGKHAPVVAPALFLATKLEAFQDRGRNDYYGSHDLEDIVALVDGRDSVVDDVAAVGEPMRSFIRAWFTRLVAHPDFQDAFPGHLSPLSRPRAREVLRRFQAIAAL